MPRGPRLDAPGVLHHVMVRGLERRAIFRDDRDRAEFARRLAALAASGALTVYAWALLPNHGHLLVPSRAPPPPPRLPALLPPRPPPPGPEQARPPPRLRRRVHPPPPPRRPSLPESLQVYRGGGGAVPPRAATST